ncbi:hypothetical protein AB0C87_25125 [Actinomadura sp. NPDC048021]
MTVGELREALEGLDDDLPVMLDDRDYGLVDVDYVDATPADSPVVIC